MVTIMDLELWLGRMARVITVTLKTTASQDEEHTSTQMAAITLEDGVMATNTAMDRTIGLTGTVTLGSFRMVAFMGLVSLADVLMGKWFKCILACGVLMFLVIVTWTTHIANV